MHAWNILVPTIKHYLNNAAMFITTNTPIIVNHVSTVLNSTCTWVYQLHPTFFDKAVTHARCAVHCTQRYVNNAWQLLLDYTPIVIEASQEYLQLAMASLQHYCAKGHDWMQNAMRYVFLLRLIIHFPLNFALISVKFSFKLCPLPP